VLYDQYVEGDHAEFTHDWVIELTEFAMAFAGSGAQLEVIGAGTVMVAEHVDDAAPPFCPAHVHSQGPETEPETAEAVPDQQRPVIAPEVVKVALWPVPHVPGIGAGTHPGPKIAVPGSVSLLPNVSNSHWTYNVSLLTIFI
jgi:hypothetical protein